MATEHAHPPEYRYHLLRAALASNQGGLAGLDAGKLVALSRKADKSFELESLVLASAEAADVIIPPTRLDAAITELTARYRDRAEFLADLHRNGLDEPVLRNALHRELVFDVCLQRMGAKRPPISDLDERLFFDLHRARFTEPERRTVWQILITVNDEFEENRREAALARIGELAEKLAESPNRFPSLARNHSECPSAMDGGRLGTLGRGQLYPELDAMLFALHEGEVGGPVETELGFHLLWCERIHPGHTQPFSKVRGSIRQLLEKRAARQCQKAWIAELREATASGGWQ
jgi:peptidyl-prolyl cis-trans isomerase C